MIVIVVIWLPENTQDKARGLKRGSTYSVIVIDNKAWSVVEVGEEGRE
jgi:hypothetical protein